MPEIAPHLAIVNGLNPEELVVPPVEIAFFDGDAHLEWDDETGNIIIPDNAVVTEGNDFDRLSRLPRAVNTVYFGSSQDVRNFIRESLETSVGAFNRLA